MRPVSLRSVAFALALLVLGAGPARPQQAPPGSTVLLPSGAFPGGVLTGVVLGPDDKPVPNTPVNIAGGVPITLTGVVVGEEEPTRPKPPERQPCQPDANGNLPPGCPPERPQPPQPQPCQPDAAGKLPAGCEPPTVSQPSDCAAILRRFAAMAGGAMPSAQPQPGATPATGPQLLTDANGRFGLCVPVDAPKVGVALPGATPQSVPRIRHLNQGGGKSTPPSFFQPGEKVDLIGLLRQPTMEQGSQTWLLPAVNAWSPSGDQVITAFQAPHDLQPGPVKLSFFDRDGRQRTFAGGVFKILSATLDRSKLRSQEGADFAYTVQFGDGSVRPCVSVSVTGPVVLTQAPPPEIKLDAGAVGRFAGKIRATQVAPGAVIPFDIKPDITDCGGPAQSVAQAPETQPGAGAGGAAPPLSPANLHAAPAVPNPWVKEEVTAPPPAAVKPASPASQVGSTPLHTMDEKGASKYAKAPPPIPVCTIQFTAPAISNVTGVNLLPPRTFTQQQGLNYYHIQGCNFGDAPGHVYLVFPPANGQQGFGTNVELYLNAPWSSNSLDVFLDPNFGGFPDENVTLQVVTAKGLKAELINCKFRAERVARTIYWFPRSQLKLGSAGSSFVTPVFQTAESSQTADLISVNQPPQQGPATATVNRSINGVGGPFTVQDDLWDFSELQPGWVVMYATPSYNNWNGEGCDQTSGHWGTYWDSSTLLRVHVQGCYHKGTGQFSSSQAFYGLTIELRGPKGTLPWPVNLK